MRAHIQSDWTRQGARIYLVDEFPSGVGRIMRLRDGHWTSEEYDQAAAEVEPSLTLPFDALEEIVRAAEGHVHPQDATTRHLDDAVATRDRLLTMIEKRGLR